MTTSRPSVSASQQQRCQLSSESCDRGKADPPHTICVTEVSLILLTLYAFP